MVSLPAKSTYLPQSKRTVSGANSGRGVAKPVTKKRANANLSPRNSDDSNPAKKRKTDMNFADLDSGDSDSNDDFNPTYKSFVPDRFQKARMKKAQAEASKGKIMGWSDTDSKDESFSEEGKIKPAEKGPKRKQCSTSKHEKMPERTERALPVRSRDFLRTNRSSRNQFNLTESSRGRAGAGRQAVPTIVPRGDYSIFGTMSPPASPLEGTRSSDQS